MPQLMKSRAKDWWETWYSPDEGIWCAMLLASDLTVTATTEEGLAAAIDSVDGEAVTAALYAGKSEHFSRDKSPAQSEQKRIARKYRNGGRG